MSKHLYGAAFVLIFTSFSPPLWAGEGVCNTSFYIRNFHHFDKDRDLKLSLKEAQALRCQPVSRAIFDQYDADQDNKLSFAEWKSLLKGVETAQSQKQNAPKGQYKDKSGSV